MDANTIVQLISSVGFPIIMCILMWKYVTDTTSKLTQAVENNSIICKELSAKLEKIGGGESE